MNRIAIAGSIAVALIASACAPPAQEQQAQSETPSQSERTTLAAAGDPVQTAPVEMDENLAWAVSVVQLDPLGEPNGGVKLFGLAGGDPAMNGLHTYIAFYENPAEGWRAYLLGDFLSYRVLSQAPGRVDLEIQESTMDEATGDIGGRTRHAIVTWTLGADDAPPTAINVTPAVLGE
ncbi:MAG: hypothetical protein AB7H66_11480 [Hyphomonadaceae bacterium]